MATKKASKKVEGTTVTIEFATGQTLTANAADLPDEMKRNLIVHGLSQKLGDSYAGADEKEAFDCANRVLEGLMKGEWSTRGEGGGGRASMFLEALAAVLGLSLDEAKAKFDSKTEEEQAAIKNHPQIKTKTAEIKAARAQADLAKAQAAASENAGALTL